MGKATIVSNLGDGRYKVKPRYYGGDVIARLIALAGREKEMQPHIDYWEAKAETALDTLKNEQWVYERCDPLGLEIEEQTKLLVTAQAEAQDLTAKMRGYKVEKASVTLEMAAIIKRIPSSLTIGHIADGELGEITVTRNRLSANVPELENRALTAWLNVEEMTVIVDDKTANVTFWQQSFDAAVESGSVETIELSQGHLGEAQSVLAQAQRDLDKGQEELRDAEAALEKAKGELDKCNTLISQAAAAPTLSLWCADYTLDLTGDVGTIELGRSGRPALIRPGGGDGAGEAAYMPSDGIAAITTLVTGAGAFYNAAVQPGVATWRPRYRTGKIISMIEVLHRATVALDPLTLTDQKINVNQSVTVVDASVDYLHCNSYAFSVGDQVVVSFQGMDWSWATVVGFADGPAPCDEYAGGGGCEEPTLFLTGPDYKIWGEPAQWQVSGGSGPFEVCFHGCYYGYDDCLGLEEDGRTIILPEFWTSGCSCGAFVASISDVSDPASCGARTIYLNVGRGYHQYYDFWDPTGCYSDRGDLFDSVRTLYTGSMTGRTVDTYESGCKHYTFYLVCPGPPGFDYTLLGELYDEIK